MLDYEVADRAEFVRREIRRLSERDGIEPEFRERAVALHVNVRRLVVFIAEEEEPVWAYTKDSRHSPLTISSSAARRKERQRLTPSPLQ
jgi:hypothetical protein